MYLFCKRWIKLILILPTLVLFLTYTVYPIYDLLITSFQNKTFYETVAFVGFDNYTSIFGDPIFFKALQNTGIMVISEFILLLPLGFLMGLLLNASFKGHGFVKVVTFAPYILSGVMIAILWLFILNPEIGIINITLNKIGLHSLTQQWIGGTKLSPYSFAIVDSWRTAGFYGVMFLTGIKMLPKDCFEAAIIDGATAVQKTIYITIPMLKETIKVCAILIINGALNSFQTAYMLTNGAPSGQSHVLTSYLYELNFRQYDLGRGAVISFVLFVVVMTISISVLGIFNRRIED